MTPGSPLASTDRDAVIALGNFDGVHLGHRRILEAVRARAAALGAEPLALTFEPHPRQFLFPDAKTSLLTAPREKTALIKALGVRVVTLPFDAATAALTAEEFATEVLMRRLRGTHFFLGADHRFGTGARGNAALLRTLLRPLLYTGGSGGMGREDCVTELPPVVEGGEPVSSSAIRHHLKTGGLLRANAMLGRCYRLRGEVVRGFERGRGLGFPTANILPEDPRKILPFGVFGGIARLGTPGEPARGEYSAVANLGMRPTFASPHEPEPSVEVHLLDWNGDLYGQTLEFEFQRFIRPEQRFDGVESLKNQIAADVENWRKDGIFT
jgi:riboflavin kinase/FMN adenylyltransferase